MASKIFQKCARTTVDLEDGFLLDTWVNRPK